MAHERRSASCGPVKFRDGGPHFTQVLNRWLLKAMQGIVKPRPRHRAFVVCQAIGLETGSAAYDYIQLWNGDKETLTSSLTF